MPDWEVQYTMLTSSPSEYKFFVTWSMEYVLIHQSLFVRINRSDELSVVNCIVSTKTKQNKLSLRLKIKIFLKKVVDQSLENCRPFWSVVEAYWHRCCIIEKVHLDDLDVYLDTLETQIFLWSSALKLAKKFNSTSFNLKQEVFIRRDEERPEEGWYLLGRGFDTYFDQRWTVKVDLHTFCG